MCDNHLYPVFSSMNPGLDMGQAEGGFMMGLGYHLTEEVVYDTTTGEILNAGTWVRPCSALRACSIILPKFNKWPVTALLGCWLPVVHDQTCCSHHIFPYPSLPGLCKERRPTGRVWAWEDFVSAQFGITA